MRSADLLNIDGQVRADNVALYCALNICGYLAAHI